jgi:hypothetical protein
MLVTIVLGVLGLVNVYVIYALNGLRDWRKGIDNRIYDLEKNSLTEEKIRKIFQEELKDFELRLIKEGRLDIN